MMDVDDDGDTWPPAHLSALERTEAARDAMLGMDLGAYMDTDLWHAVQGNALLFWFALSPERRENIYRDYQDRLRRTASTEYLGPWPTACELSHDLQSLVPLIQAFNHADTAFHVMTHVFGTTPGFTREEAMDGRFRENEPLGDHFMRKYWSMPSDQSGWSFFVFCFTNASSRQRLLTWSLGHNLIFF